eukprot:2216074-Pleurochrysis_carterae.AAC.1
MGIMGFAPLPLILWNPKCGCELGTPPEAGITPDGARVVRQEKNKATTASGCGGKDNGSDDDDCNSDGGDSDSDDDDDMGDCSDGGESRHGPDAHESSTATGSGRARGASAVRARDRAKTNAQATAKARRKPGKQEARKAGTKRPFRSQQDGPPSDSDDGRFRQEQ